MTNLPDRLKKLRECAERATKGPWEMRPIDLYEKEEPGTGFEIVAANGQQILDNQTYYPAAPEENEAAHIAAFNPDTALKLLDLIERQRRALGIIATTVRDNNPDAAIARAALAFDPFEEG